MFSRTKFSIFGTCLAKYRSFSSATNIQLVKDLRSQTGAPVGDVKAALEEANWNLQDAFGVLRKKGLAAAQKKQSRLALQGQIGVAKKEGCVVLVELNCETDFVAKTDSFYSLLPKIAQVALENQLSLTLQKSTSQIDVEILKTLKPSEDGNDTSVGDMILDVATNVRENIQLRRAYMLKSENGIACSYIHNAVQPGFSAGQIGTALILDLEPTIDQSIGQDDRIQALQDLGNKLCMQIAAFNPLALDRDSVPQQMLEQEKEVLMEKARAEGKPEKVLEKIIQGQLNKYYEENVLLEQKYVMDDSVKVKDILQQKAKELGVESVLISDFLYVKCGDHSDQQSQQD